MNYLANFNQSWLETCLRDGDSDLFKKTKKLRMNSFEKSRGNIGEEKRAFLLRAITENTSA